MTEHAFWITSRAAGIVALLAASLAVALGLMMSTRLRTRLGDLRVVHESLSLATMVALAVHALALLGDSYLKPEPRRRHDPVRQLLRAAVDGRRPHRRLAVRDPRALVLHPRPDRPQRWRKLHRFTALAWVLGIGHALMMGTDAGAAWFLVAAALVVIPAAALLAAPAAPRPGDRMSHQSFDCFGSRCGIWVTGRDADQAVADARHCLENWHRRFSRFRPASELSRLNADPREVVPVSTTMTQPAARRARGGGSDRRPRRRHAARRDRGRRLLRRPRRAAAAAAGAGARPAAPAGRRRTLAPAGARSPSTGWEVTRPRRRRLRQRRPRQGPVRRPARRAACRLPQLRRRLRRRPALRRP